MTKLVVHVGTHKTGTTTIQYALNNISSKSRLEEGWDYIESPIITEKLMVTELYDVELVKKFSSSLERLISLSNKTPVKIMSSELLSGSAVNGYLNSKAVATILHEATKKYDVKIIMYIRLQDELVESMYSQFIHQGDSFSFDEYINQLDETDSFNYKRIIKDWHDSFGEENVIVRSYHSAAEFGLLKDFGEVIDSAKVFDFSMGAHVKNPGYSYDAIEIARLVNKKAHRASKVVLRSVMQKTMTKTKLNKHSLFLGDGRKIFLSKYLESNQEVSYLCSNLIDPNSFLGANKDLNFLDISSHKDSVKYEDIAPLVEEFLLLSVGNKDKLRVLVHDRPKLVFFLKKIMRYFK